MALRGQREMVAKMRAFAEQFPERVSSALKAEADIELREVNERTPRETGALRDSNRVEGPVREGSRTVVYIVSGNAQADYALYVHEDLEAFHPVGQAKYLESVVLESAPYMLQRLASRLKI